ncbi:MAG: YlbF family regulator [Eubacteriales bacterium]|nr:YlbF family regulator [Eubacteriales bacterium]
MNVYDQAHNLAQAVTESQEFQEFDRMRKQVEQDEGLSKMIKDFEQKQMEIQAKQMAGEMTQQEAMQAMQSIMPYIAANPAASSYLQAQMRFTLMLHDVVKIVGDAVGMDTMPNI